jgi:hypothetical protein
MPAFLGFHRDRFDGCEDPDTRSNKMKFNTSWFITDQEERMGKKCPRR